MGLLFMAHDFDDSTPRARGIYLLPNLFTVTALFAGFYAIVIALKGNYETAAIAIFIAMLFDGLDGRVARMTHTTSDFGAQLDSLCDMVCFGVGPALILYNWSLYSLGKPGWLAAFIYAVCTALRLARFNTQLNKLNPKYSQGITTTAAAGLIASMIWVATKYDITGVSIALPVMIITIMVGVLKVSTIRYHSFKSIDLRGRVPFIVIILLVMALVLVSFDPPDILLAVFAGYVISGPVMTLWGLSQHRRKKPKHR